jgi:hypothetical protein
MYVVGFEVFTTVAMKSVVIRNVAPYEFTINRRFGVTYRLHLLGRRNNASEENC